MLEEMGPGVCEKGLLGTRAEVAAAWVHEKDNPAELVIAVAGFAGLPVLRLNGYAASNREGM